MALPLGLGGHASEHPLVDHETGQSVAGPSQLCGLSNQRSTNAYADARCAKS
jgi:hypothetical protein